MKRSIAGLCPFGRKRSKENESEKLTKEDVTYIPLPRPCVPSVLQRFLPNDPFPHPRRTTCDPDQRWQVASHPHSTPTIVLHPCDL